MMDGGMDGLTNGLMTDGQMDRWMHGCMDAWMYGHHRKAFGREKGQNPGQGNTTGTNTRKQQEDGSWSNMG